MNDIVHKQPAATISKLYADDLKSYTVVRETAYLNDIKSFSDTLAHIHDWSLQWQLPVAGQKCQWMFIYNKKSIVEHNELFV